jgi:hypothetical protein
MPIDGSTSIGIFDRFGRTMNSGPKSSSERPVPAGQERADLSLRPVAVYDDREQRADFLPTVTELNEPLSAPALPSTTGPRVRRVRSLFWPGFAAAFLILSIFSCGGLAMATGLNRIDLQNSGPAWTPPAITPTSADIAVASAANSNQPAGAFQIGETVHNIASGRVNIRQQPGRNKEDILAQSVTGDTFQIISGPQAADGLTWWQVSYTTRDGRPIQGWVAEATGSGVKILGR